MKAPNFNLGNPDRLARKLVVATLGSLWVRLAGMFVSLLVGVQMARYLGPAEYGSYGTMMAVVTMLMVPAQFGMPQLATRDISIFVTKGAMDDAKGAMIWFTAAVFGISGVFALAGIAGCLIWAAEAKESLALTCYWGLASIPLLTLGNLGVAMMRGFHRVVAAQIFDALVRPAIIAVLLFVALAAFGRLDASGAMAVQMIAAAATLGLCAWSLWRLTPRELKRAKTVARWRAWAASAVPMTGTELLRALDGQYAVLIFGALASLHDVGIFRLALTVSGLIGLPSTLVNLVVMPYVAQLYASSDTKRLQLIASGSAFAMFASTLIVTIALVLVGKPVIALVFGNTFRDSWLPLVVISVAYTIHGFFGSGTVILNMTGHERAVTRAHAAGLAVGIGLTLALYGLCGTSAAAIAMVASEIVKGGILWNVARNKLSLDSAAISAIRRPDGTGSPQEALILNFRHFLQIGGRR